MLKEIERTVYRNVQLITVHSRGNAEYMAREGVAPQKVAVVPNWVDTRLIQPASRETAYRQKAGLEGKFVVLFAGMLGFAQDVDTIVEAGTFLHSRRDILLLIVGDGVEKERLREKGPPCRSRCSAPWSPRSCWDTWRLADRSWPAFPKAATPHASSVKPVAGFAFHPATRRDSRKRSSRR